jgi:DNA (cytosine-5)-methyltransferase 1
MAEVELELPFPPTVSEAIGDLPEIEVFDELFESDCLLWQARDASSYARRLNGADEDPDDFSYRRLYDRGLLTGLRRTRHSERSKDRFAATPPGSTEPVSRYFRLKLDGLANTLRAGTGRDYGSFSAPRPIHPLQPRCITVREAARLHSFPDWFRFHHTIWHGFREIGNAVPPLVARAIGAEVLSALEVVPMRPRDPIELGDQSAASFDMDDAARFFEVSPTAIPSRKRARASEHHQPQVA